MVHYHSYCNFCYPTIKRIFMSRIDRIMSCAFPVIVLLLCLLYYFVNPLSTSFGVKCIWKVLTGTQCPACGVQRALHFLLHGNIIKALSYNYFFIISIPYAILAILASWYNYNHIFDKLRNIVYCGKTLKVYIVLFFIWWIVRNIFGL